MAELILTASDNGKSFETKSGETIVVRLAENPTTGYAWGIDQLDDQLLVMENSDYVSSSGNLAGRGGERTFTFVTRNVGQTKLQLKHWRAWEGDKSITDRYTVTLQIA